MFSVRTLTGPTVEPVTLAEARLWCRVDDDDTTQDWALVLLISAAREKAEEITGLALASRTLELRLDSFPIRGRAIELPQPPLQSVQYVTYATSAGDVVMSGSPQEFVTDTGSNPGRVAPLAGGSWPSTVAQPSAVRIGYTAGYTNVTAMPKRVRIFMQGFIAALFDNREQLIVNNVVEIPRDFGEGLLDRLRVTIGMA